MADNRPEAFNEFTPQDAKDIADAVDRFYRGKHQQAVTTTEIARVEFPPVLGKVAEGYQDIGRFIIDGVGVTFHLIQTPFGALSLDVIPAEGKDVYLLIQDPKYKSYEWKKVLVEERKPEPELRASSNYPNLPSPYGNKGWTQSKMRADFNHEAVVKVVDKQTGQERNFKLESKLAGRADKIPVKSTLSEVKLSGVPELPKSQ